MKASPALVALATIAVVLAGGCSPDYAGGDKDEVIAQGNAICKANGATVQPALEQLLADDPVPTTAELRSFAGDVALPGLQKRVGELRELDPPREDRDEVDDIIRAYQKAIDSISADPNLLVDADPFLQAHVKASAYGLTSCAD